MSLDNFLLNEIANQDEEKIYIIKIPSAGSGGKEDLLISSSKYGRIMFETEITLSNGSFVLNDKLIRNTSRAHLQLKSISGTPGSQIVARCEDGKVIITSSSSSDNSTFYLQIWY
ncbi:MAG: hypothetical protein ABIK72_07275 [candidate division WOR-3 bacterium]